MLVSHYATESRPLWSPDGKQLAFISTCTGGGDIYVLTLATGELKRMTMSGQTKEMHPRPVNVEVVRTPGEAETNTDSQLEAAVIVLLQQVANEEQ